MTVVISFVLRVLDNPCYMSTSSTPTVNYSSIGPRDTPFGHAPTATGMADPPRGGGEEIFPHRWLLQESLVSGSCTCAMLISWRHMQFYMARLSYYSFHTINCALLHTQTSVHQFLVLEIWLSRGNQEGEEKQKSSSPPPPS